MAENTVRLPHLATTPLPPTRSPGRPKGRLNNATLEIRAFFRDFFESPRYRENLKKRILAGKANHMEILGHYYGYGKPKQPYQVDVRPPLTPLFELVKHMSKDQIRLLSELTRSLDATAPTKEQLRSGQLPSAIRPPQAPHS